MEVTTTFDHAHLPTADALAQQMQVRAQRGRGAVVVCNVDHFSQVNLEYGHEVGDQVIAEFHRLVRGSADDAPMGRSGAAEVILARTGSQASAFTLGERIRARVDELGVSTKAGPIRITCSVGVSRVGSLAADWNMLLRTADEALLQSIRRGGNTTVAWEGSQANAHEY